MSDQLPLLSPPLSEQLPEPSQPSGARGYFCAFVPGEPAPQGSKRHVGRGIMVESSKRLKPWRTDVREAVAASLPVNWSLDSPMRVRLLFMYRRPKGHFNTKGQLKPKVPKHYQAKKNDIDKLCRAVLDAMTSVAYFDDCQVFELQARKCYTLSQNATSGVFIEIEAVG